MPNNNPQQTTPQQQIARAAESATRTAERLESGAEQAASAAIEKVRQVREDAQSGIEHQRDQIAQRIRRVGNVLQSSSQTLATDDPLSQQLFETAGDTIERVAQYIGNITPSDFASDVQSLARRRPGLFFGGSFILGLAVGRFAKSSASAVSGTHSELDDYEQTLTVRRAPQRKTKNAASRSAAPRNSSSSLPTGVSGSERATTGTGSAHSPQPNAAPSYGASTAATPQAEQSASADKPRAYAVEPGQGSKS